MSLLVVGLSHRTAPLPVLERAALDGPGARRLAARALRAPSCTEALVLATCNRLELYADVTTFHAGVRDLSTAIAEAVGGVVAGVVGEDHPGDPAAAGDLADHLYFHYGEAAVAHLFTVASGLDSMAVGESQVLGQVRTALRRAQEDGTAGRALHGLVQQALRVGKRVHAETGLDRAGAGLVEAALAGAEDVVGPLPGARALVVGAGAMSALAATTLHRRGLAEVVVANRTPARAQRLAEAVGGRWLALDDAAALQAALAAADVVVSCTGAVGTVLPAGALAAARRTRSAPQLVVDLALPHDVDPAVADLPGVRLLGLAELGERLRPTAVADDVDAARRIVAEEVAVHLAAERAASVAPTVTALRSLAREVVDAELARLHARLGGDVDARVAAEAELAVHRVVEKLLHPPTVNVKALAAGSADGATYAAALRRLFDLADLGTGDPTGASTTTGEVADVLRAVPAPALAEPGSAR